jgi:hypothetical protein
MNYPYRRIEMTLGEHIRHLFENYRRAYNHTINDSVVVHVAEQRKVENQRENLLRLIDELACGKQIIYAPGVEAALEEAKSRHRNYDFDSFSWEREIFEKTLLENFSLSNPGDLSDVMSWFIHHEGAKDQRPPLSEFGKQSRQLNAQAKSKSELRLKLLFKIMEGRKTSYEKWDAREGKIVFIDARTLETKSNEELAEIARDVASLRGVSREDQRQKLQRVADSHKDYKPYRPGDTDSLDTDAVPTQYKEGNDNTSAIRVRTETRHGETDRAVSQVSSTASTDSFINPETGRVYNKKEVYGLATKDLNTFRKLLKADKNRLNLILSGE